MKKINLQKRIGALILGTALIVTSIGAVPSISYAAGSPMTIDYEIVDSSGVYESAGKTTMTMDVDGSELSLTFEGADAALVEMDVDYASTWVNAPATDQAYTTVKYYDFGIHGVKLPNWNTFTYNEEDGSTTYNSNLPLTGTLSIPIPSGYTQYDAKECARLSVVDEVWTDNGYVYSAGSYSVKPTSVTATTVSFNVPVDYFWYNGEVWIIRGKYFVGYKQHTHSSASTWNSDASNHWQVCSICGDSLNISAHSFDSGVVTTAATYTSAGLMTYTCSVCGYQKTETIAALPAVEGTDVVTTSGGGAKYKVAGVGEDGTVAKVTKVADGAFKNNKKLQSVSLGKNVETIGKNAFSGDTKLKTVKMGKNAFKNVENATIKVPKKKVDAYTKLVEKSGASSTVTVKKK